MEGYRFRIHCEKCEFVCETVDVMLFHIEMEHTESRPTYSPVSPPAYQQNTMSEKTQAMGLLSPVSSMDYNALTLSDYLAPVAVPMAVHEPGMINWAADGGARVDDQSMIF